MRESAPLFPAMGSVPTTIGRYAIRRVLGRGGMGTVYLAVDPLIEREVAIKVLPLAGADDYSERLIAEARVSGRLIHPHIVGVFDIGEEHGQPFVVMPYVDGRTVAAILTDATRPPMAAKLRWMAQLCDALAYAHERRVIHRDIKPTNLLIDAQGNLRVLDFGIAKVLTTSQIQFTSVGTPAYMAPEQYSSDPVDPRTDVFSAGLVFYELLTHKRALTGTTPAQIYGQLMGAPMPRVLAAAPETDPALAAVCERAMSREPRDRFQTARELGEALAGVQARNATARITIKAATESATPSTDPPTAATVSSAAPLAAGSGQATGWWRAVTTTSWRFALPAAAVSVIAAVLVFGPARFATPPPTDSAVSPSAQASPPAPTGGTAPSRLDPVPPSIPGEGSATPQTAAAQAIGRLRVTSDLDGAVFNATPVRGRGVIALTKSGDNVLSPARYEVRASYVDRDPLMGDTSRPTTSRQTVDVAAGQTATLRFALEAVLWRDRFERALARPAGQRAAVLDRTYRRLKELSSTTPADEARFNAAAGEQQFVTLVKGDFATDTGLERYVVAQVDILQIDRVVRQAFDIGLTPPTLELTKGRHEFVLIVTARFDAGGKLSAPCSGSFIVPGGPSALQLKVDAIARRPNPKDQLTADCQIGGTVPLKRTVVPERPNPPPPRPSSFTVHVGGDDGDIPGATVEAQGPSGFTIARVSNERGIADFGDLRPGRYHVTVSLTGFRGVSEWVVLEAGTPKRLLTTLRIPVGSTTTDSGGKFSMKVPPGRYTIVVERRGFQSVAYEDVVITTTQGAWIEARMEVGSAPETVTTTRRPRATGGRTIAGVVFDSTGAPVPGATAWARRVR